MPAKPRSPVCALLILLGAVAPLLGSEAPHSQASLRDARGTDLAPRPDALFQREEPGPRLDGANDPPGLLAEDRLPAMTSLAARLSRDRGWLTAEVVDVLGERSLPLDELFSEAPRYVTLDGRAYRIKVEKVGTLWDGFRPGTDPFLVFLTQEVYDRLGPDRAIGYRDGEETIVRATDFERLPAIALTLAGVPVGAAVEIPSTAPELGLAPIALGAARTPRRLPGPPVEPVRTGAGFDLSSITGAAACSPEVAPTGCSGTTLLCPTGYTPYFLVTTITIYDDHEGCCFKGDPEIELYPLQIDRDSPPGGAAAHTDWIFDGRTVFDLAGRSRFLPDINNTGQLYGISGGLALFPTNMGTKWASTLIEDDDTAGQLKIDNGKINLFQIVDTGGQIYNDAKKMEVLKLIKDTLSLVDILGLTNDSDDLYQDSLGFTNGLFCSTGLGQPFPHGYTFTTTDWQLQGHFACVNAGCPDPSGDPGGDPVGTDCSNFDYSQCNPYQACQVFCQLGSSGTFGPSCCGCSCNGGEECPVCFAM